MKNIKYLLLLVSLVALYSCNDDPYFEFKGENRIYFQFPFEKNFAGIETGRLLDSLAISLYHVDPTAETYDLWIKVRVTGDTPTNDQKYSVEVDEKSMAKSGIDFEKISEVQTFRAGNGMDSIKITINMDQAKTALVKTIFLNLKESDGLKIGFSEYKSFKIFYSAQRQEPDAWYLVAHLLGEYHFLKYEKFIELSGTEDFGTGPFNTYYAKKVVEYFSNNIVLCPITGERILCV